MPSNDVYTSLMMGTQVLVIIMPIVTGWLPGAGSRRHVGISALLDNPKARGKDNQPPRIQWLRSFEMGSSLVTLVYTNLKHFTIRQRMQETISDKTPGDDYIIRNEPLDPDEMFAVAHQGTNKDVKAELQLDMLDCVPFKSLERALDKESSGDYRVGVVDSNGVWTECKEDPEDPDAELSPGVPKYTPRDEYLFCCYWGYRELHPVRAVGRKPTMFDRYFAVVEGVRSQGGPKEWAARDAEAFRAYMRSRG